MTSPLNRRTLLLGVVPAAALGLSACGSSSSQSSASASASASASTAATSARASVSATASASASADDGYVGYRLNREVPGAGTATLYTDYQCPYCAKAEPTYEKVAKDLEGTMNVTVRNMPLSSHKNAVPAAQAVQAAELQGKHLEMANKLFETQDSWKDVSQTDLAGVFIGYAQELGLDEEKFRDDLGDSKTLDLIKGDFEYGQKIGVKGTPQFVVNDKPLENVDTSTSAEDMAKEFKKAAGLS